jgi:hypothetical protein
MECVPALVELPRQLACPISLFLGRAFLMGVTMLADRRWWRWWLAAACVAAFWVAGVTFVLLTAGWVGSAEPVVANDLDLYVADYLRFRQATLPATWVANVAVAAGSVMFGMLVVLAGYSAVIRNGVVARAAVLLAFTGSVIFAATQLASLGALEAVLDAGSAVVSDPRELATWTQVIDRTDDYVENFGVVLIAVSLFGLRLPVGDGLARWWRISGMALAAALIVSAVASFADLQPWDQIALAVIALVLVPACATLLGGRWRTVPTEVGGPLTRPADGADGAVSPG